MLAAWPEWQFQAVSLPLLVQAEISERLSDGF